MQEFRFCGAGYVDMRPGVWALTCGAGSAGDKDRTGGGGGGHGGGEGCSPRRGPAWGPASPSVPHCKANKIPTTLLSDPTQPSNVTGRGESVYKKTAFANYPAQYVACVLTRGQGGRGAEQGCITMRKVRGNRTAVRKKRISCTGGEGGTLGGVQVE